MTEEYQKKLEELRKKYQEKVAERTTKLNDVLNKAKATYDDANDYSIKTGETLSETLLNGITDDLIFDGKLPYGAAKEIIFPMIHDNYELVTKYCEGVQNALNEQANIHLKYVKPEFEKDRAYGIINGISRDEYDKIKNSFLGETIINQSQDIVTESVKANAKFQYETGMHPKIVRTVAGGCCDWCANLAGTYDYETVKATGNDVWRRHRYCRCTVTYDPGNGKRVQNAYSKKWVDREEIENRKEFSISTISKYATDVTAEYYGTAQPGTGRIEMEEGFNANDRKDELNMAKFLHETFGGDILLYKEKNNQLNPDYLWRGKLWDLKTPEKGVSDSGIRHGLKQIKDNPGGLIIDFRKIEFNIKQVFSKLDDRVNRSSVKKVDVMLIDKNKKIKVYRYKK